MRFVWVLRIRVLASYCTMTLIHAVRNRTLSPRCTPSITSGKVKGKGHFTITHMFSNLYALGSGHPPKEAVGVQSVIFRQTVTGSVACLSSRP